MRHPAARMSPDRAREIALAWQAGFVDGEGCLTIGRQIRKGRPSPAFRAMITVSNTDRSLLEPFIEMWGGGVYVSRKNRNGWAPAHTWHCPDRQIVPFLTAVKPFLRGKAQQADVLIEFIANKKKFRRIGLGQGLGSAPLGAEEIIFREGLWNRARLLNSKGQYSRRALESMAS